jgi:hypothetical protein
MTRGKIRASFPDTPEGHALMEQTVTALAHLLKSPPKIRDGHDANGVAYILLYFDVVEEKQTKIILKKP